MPIIKVNAQDTANVAAQLIAERATLWIVEDGPYISCHAVAAVDIVPDETDDATPGFWVVTQDDTGLVRLESRHGNAGSAIIAAKAIARDRDMT